MVRCTDAIFFLRSIVELLKTVRSHYKNTYVLGMFNQRAPFPGCSLGWGLARKTASGKNVGEKLSTARESACPLFFAHREPFPGCSLGWGFSAKNGKRKECRGEAECGERKRLPPIFRSPFFRAASQLAERLEKAKSKEPLMSHVKAVPGDGWILNAQIGRKAEGKGEPAIISDQ